MKCMGCIIVCAMQAKTEVSLENEIASYSVGMRLGGCGVGSAS